MEKWTEVVVFLECGLPSVYLLQHQFLLWGLGFSQCQVCQESLQICQVGQLVH